jgi:hypothetical protein
MRPRPLLPRHAAVFYFFFRFVQFLAVLLGTSHPIPKSPFTAIFILVWFFPIINRMENLISGEDNNVFVLALLHAVFSPLQGGWTWIWPQPVCVRYQGYRTGSTTSTHPVFSRIKPFDRAQSSVCHWTAFPFALPGHAGVTFFGCVLTGLSRGRRGGRPVWLFRWAV